MRTRAQKNHLLRRTQFHHYGIKPQHIVLGIAIFGFIACAIAQFLS